MTLCCHCQAHLFILSFTLNTWQIKQNLCYWSCKKCLTCIFCLKIYEQGHFQNQLTPEMKPLPFLQVKNQLSIVNIWLLCQSIMHIPPLFDLFASKSFHTNSYLFWLHFDARNWYLHKPSFKMTMTTTNTTVVVSTVAHCCRSKNEFGAGVITKARWLKMFHFNHLIIRN